MEKNSFYPKFGVNHLLSTEIENNERIVIAKLSRIVSNKANKNLKIIEGDPLDIIKEEMKYFDLILLGRKEILSNLNKEILQHHYKPLILIKEIPVSFENIIFANDRSFRSNKSLFCFINVFDDLNKFKSISINSKETDNKLLKYIEKSKLIFEFKEFQGKIFEILQEESKNSGLVICGNLGHSYMYEKITKNEGLKVINQLKSPLFIM